MDFYRPPNTNKTVEQAPKKDQKLEKFLKKVDFHLLKIIFDDYAKKSGVAPADVNFLGPEKIFYKKGRGAHFSSNNTISMNADITLDSAVGISSGIPPDLLRLRNLIHEEVHAVSFRNSVKHSETESEYSSGYKSAKEVITEKGNGVIQIDEIHFFRLFDEAVTERLAREITKRYLETHPEFTNAVSRNIYAHLDKNPNIDIYQVEVDLLEALIKRLSIETGLSQEMVWEGLIRSKLEGFFFFDDGMQELFDELVGPDFAIKLKSVNTLQGLRDLTKMIESAPGASPTTSQRIIRKTRDIFTSPKDRKHH